MVKRKRSILPPQLQRSKKSPPSQHDKRTRLRNPNCRRVRTQEARCPLLGGLAELAKSMQSMLDSRTAFRFSIILVGILIAKGRRTASSWFRAAGVKDDWDRFYDALGTIGRNLFPLAIPLIRNIVRKFDPGPEGHWTLALDDSPTRRFGRHVEGANVHRNPTPGPVDGDWLYGHNWVCLAMLLSHPLWGVIALPVLSALYVRQQDVNKLNSRYGWEFKTKHQLGLELVTRLVSLLRSIGCQTQIVLVVDGAYATAMFLKKLHGMNVTLVSRLRRNAVLFGLPPERRVGQRGRPRKYGSNKLSLVKRAASRQGWESITYVCRGIEVTRRYKSFLATTTIAQGAIRVVIVEFGVGQWAAYFSSDTDMEVKMILETVSARWAIEECFHDLKEVWRAGEQQVRSVWSNLACWQMNCWMYTMVELESWDVLGVDLIDRSDRPWDNPDRRPSHADRRRAVCSKMLRERFSTVLASDANHEKLKRLFDEFLAIAA